MAKIGTVVIELDANTAKLVQGIKKSNRQISQMQESVNKAKSSMANFAKAAVGIYAVGKAFSFAADSITSFTKTAAQFEQYETTLKSITGSSTQAKESMDWIGDFTAKTPFQLAQVTDAFVKMKAYGLDPMDGTLEVLGNTASAMGKDIAQAVEAMADAVTGENERLKEFGVKAKLQGEKVFYTWSDSSGKARNIVIQNNKEMIQSTLNAIFNEKYVGAMEAQSNTWNGIISNMSDSWTMFQRDVMSEGLFAYFKSLARVVSEYMRAAFGDAKTAAKGFSDGVIEYINGVIKAVGFLKDAISGISLASKAVQYSVLFMSKAVMQALNAPMNAINYLIDRYNALGDVLGYSKATVKAPTIDTSWTDNTMAQLKKEMSDIVGDLANESGQKLAEKIIGKTKEGISGVTSELDELNKRKSEAKATLDAIGAGYGDIEKKATKAGKAASKAAKEAKKELEELKKKAEDTAKSIASIFQQGFKLIFSGDFAGGISAMFNDIVSSATSSVAGAFSKGIGNVFTKGAGSFADAFKSLTTGDWIGTAISLIGGLFSSHVTQAEIDASRGRVEFSDKSLANLENIFESVQYPMLEVTNKMHKHIRNMDANFYSIARAFSGQASAGGIDLTGANFADTMETGFLGFSSKSISLIGTGLLFELQSLSEVMNEAELSVQAYTTTLVKKSSFWGLFKSSKIKEEYKNIPPEIIADLADSFAYGYETILTSGVALGIEEANLERMLQNADVNLGKIDFTGLSQGEIANRLSQSFGEAFSGVIDQIPELNRLVDRYVKHTEESMETLGRIVLEYDQASYIFGLIGKDFEDNITTLGDITSNFWGLYDGFLNNIITSTYTAQMQILDIVEAAGGIDNFNDSMNAFISSFYTDQEQYKMQTKEMAESFSTLGIAMPKTNDEFRSLIENFDTSTEEGARLYGQIITLSEGFAQMTSAGQQLRQEELDRIEALQQAGSQMIQSISDDWIGNLSYLNKAQKAEFASNYFAIARESNGALSTVDAARAMAETALKTTATRDEYIPIFERYIAEKEKEVKDASNRDLLDELRAVKEEVKELREATYEVARVG